MPEYCVVVVRGATGERAARLSTTREHRSGAQRVSERDEFSLLSAAGRRGGGGGVRPTSVRYDAAAAAAAAAAESYYRVSSRHRRTHLNDLPVGRPSTGIYEDLRRSFVTRRWSIRGATRSFAFYSAARRHVPAPSGRPVFTVWPALRRRRHRLRRRFIHVAGWCGHRRRRRSSCWRSVHRRTHLHVHKTLPDHHRRWCACLSCLSDSAAILLGISLIAGLSRFGDSKQMAAA